MALATLLGPEGTVHAVDHDATALRALQESPAPRRGRLAAVRTLVGDFSAEIDLHELDGVVMANALHYVPYDRQAAVLERVGTLVKPGRPLVLIEYDRRGPNPWVPYPVPPGRLEIVAREAELTAPAFLAARRSRYGGSIYSAVVRRGGSDSERRAGA
jgi:SAM-dependent methyltransferase